MVVLSHQAIRKRMRELEGWRLNGTDELSKTFDLADFPRVMVFISSIGWLAESKHCDRGIKFLVQHKTVVLDVFNGMGPGLTEKEFDIARQIDSLPTVVFDGKVKVA